MLKEVLFGKQARDKVLAGVKKITDAVRVTMGSSGKCVLVGEGFFGNDGLVALPTIITKDGYTVTKHFELADRVENRGALMIKEAAMKTVIQAGDATTCTCVLAEAIVSRGTQLIEEGGNSQEIKKGIDNAVEQAVAELKKMSTLIGDDNDKIFQVATVSANNDPAIGRLIADAFKKIGNEGLVDIEAGTALETEIRVSDGYKFDRSWVHPLFINKNEKQVCEFEDPLIVLYDKRITHHTQILKAVETSLQTGKPLLVICEDAVEEGLAFLLLNKHEKRVKICVVKSPSFGDDRRIEMEDIALLTGGEFMGDIRGKNIKEIKQGDYGRAKKVIVTKDETIIIGGEGKKSEIENLLNELRMNLAQAKNEDEKFPIEKRIARLTSGIAVIQVGGATETEMNEKLDRFDDAVRSTKSAISEGFVAGGGTAFVRIAGNVMIDENQTPGFRAGQQLIKDILAAPIKQMAFNAGVNGDDVYEYVKASSGNDGYNTRTERFEDMVEAGIIDSTKALRCALINAASVAGMLLTTEAIIETIG